MSRILDVYLHDKLAGKLIQNDEGKLIFQYAEEYLHDPAATQVSICLPLRAEQFKEKSVRAFFSGLLPDEDARNRLAKCLGVSAKNPFKLLELVENMSHIQYLLDIGIN